MKSSRPRLEVSILNEQRQVRLSRVRVAFWTRKILRTLGWKRVRLSLALVDDRRIRSLHRRHLGKDSPTDVLAFPPAARFGPVKAPRGFDGDGTPFLGEVVVSVETARRAAPLYGHPWDQELLLYICHGILHLRGARDGTPRQRACMTARQESVLRRILGKTWPFKKQKLLS